jgi:hypothetical protein
MRDGLMVMVGLHRHAVLGSSHRGGQETISVVFATLDDARALVD